MFLGKLDSKKLSYYENNILNLNSIKMPISYENFKFWNFNRLEKKIVDKNIIDTESFAMRLAQWKLCFKILLKDIKTFLFGTGYIQSDKGYVIGFAIDNVYLQVLVNIGLIGFLLWVFFVGGFVVIFIKHSTFYYYSKIFIVYFLRFYRCQFL